MVKEPPSIDPWSRREKRSHPVVAVVVLVGITVGAVLLARGTLLSGDAGTMLAWLACGTALVIAVPRSFRGPRRGSVLSTGPGLRRDAVSVATDARRHRRFVPARRTTILYTHDGRQIPARIVDISIAAVAVEARLTDLEIMAVSRVGGQSAGAVRRTPNGAVFGFETLLDPRPLDASFVL